MCSRWGCALLRFIVSDQRDGTIVFVHLPKRAKGRVNESRIWTTNTRKATKVCCSLHWEGSGLQLIRVEGIDPGRGPSGQFTAGIHEHSSLFYFFLFFILRYRLAWAGMFARLPRIRIVVRNGYLRLCVAICWSLTWHSGAFAPHSQSKNLGCPSKARKAPLFSCCRWRMQVHAPQRRNGTILGQIYQVMMSTGTGITWR